MVTLAGQNLQRHIENSDVSAVTTIISNGVINLDERDDNGQTFLMIAAQQGNLEVVNHLLSCEVDVNAVDNDNWTALLNASKEGHADIVLTLVENGANIEHKDLGCWTALTWSCYKGRTNCAILLLEKGSNPNVKGEHHMSCLTWAAGRGHLEIVKALLHHGAKVNTADKFGTTPLIWAARKGHLDIVETLLDEGANVDNSGMNSWTALYVAAKGGFGDCVRAILACGPNVNAVDKDGFTALTVAAKEGHLDIVYNLLLKGAYVNLPDRYGDSILTHAVKGGHLEVVQALLEKCADVDVTGVDGKTALYWAIEKSHNDIGKAILENNPSLETQTKDGDTVLSKAVRCRNNEMVDLLLKKGAKVSAADKRGDTPLHIAVRGRSKRITETLLRNPKDSRLLYRPNRGGETPYQLDAQHQKSILTQIFGTRQLNAEENIAGYDLYSSTIADVLSEPTLTTPITVGLYAKWGSGKSFLINTLQKEMRSFTQQKSEPLFSFSWLQFFITLLISVVIGLVFAFTITWYVGLAAGGGVFLILYVLLGFVWFGTFKRDWNAAYKISTYLAKKLQYFQLLLQIIFCNQPKKPPNETAGVRFLFTDNARLASVVGEKSITAMIATLCDSLDQEYGMLVTRLFRVFKPRKAAENGRFKSFCCIPYFVMVIFIVLCFIAGITLLFIFGIQNIYDRKYTAVDSVLIALAIIVGIAIIGNSYTWGRMIMALLISQQKKVQRIGRHIESLKMEGFMQKLKHEVELMGQMVKCMDSFTNHHTRLVVIVDGLDSCEQDKLLQVLDTVHMLFGEAHSPFITVLAVDPHVVIKGIEHNLHGFFRDTSINGHDYLRNIVHLPFFLQIQTAPMSPLKRNVSVRSEHQSGEARASGRILSRTDSVMSSNSELGEGSKKGKAKSSIKARGNNSLQRQPSTMDLSKSLSKNSYFSDVNPRNLRRLMNIIAVTARILRACNIDFNWYRLMSWINVTEQWPYRLSWIILYVEDSESIDDSVTLKHIYEKVSSKMPASKEVEPLLEIDRNPRKLEIFLSSHSPALNVGDLRKFLPCTINVDPYLRKLIREMQQAAETANEMALSAYNPMNPPEQNMLPWLGQNRPPSRLDVYNSTSPRSTPINRRGSISNAFMPLPQTQMFMMHSMMQGMMGYQSPQLATMNRNSPRFPVKGVNLDVRLSSLSVEGVCEVLSKLEGLNIRKLDEYCTTIHRSNISGMVLLNCNLDELKSEMKMNFGDWELFRNVILAMREREAMKGQDLATPNPYDSGSPELHAPYVNFTEGNAGVRNAGKKKKVPTATLR